MRDNTQNPFEILGLKPAYPLDSAAVERAAMMKLASAHPDMVGDSGLDASTQINDARKALLDDEERANVLLSIFGGPSSDADRTLPQNFLMEMMALRSRIEEEFEADSEDARERWTREAARRREELKAQVTPLFESAAADSDARTEIRVLLNQWRYFERLLEQLDEAPGRPS